MASPRKTSTTRQPVRCFIAAFENRAIDARLEGFGFSRGVLLFAIPELGILFRCRASGEMIDLEFGAMFALLKFIKDKLADLGIKQVQILSSNPEFVFAFTGQSRHLVAKTERMKMLKEYNRLFQILIGFVEPRKNQAMVRAVDYPSMPDSRSIGLSPDEDKLRQTVFKPFQRGLRL